MTQPTIQTCTHCGAILPAQKINISAILGRKEFAVYEYIRTHPDCERDHIHARLYGSRDYAVTPGIVNVFICNINRKFRELRLGIHIQASGRGPGAAYRLMKDSTDVTPKLPARLQRLRRAIRTGSPRP